MIEISPCIDFDFEGNDLNRENLTGADTIDQIKEGYSIPKKDKSNKIDVSFYIIRVL